MLQLMLFKAGSAIILENILKKITDCEKEKKTDLFMTI